MEQLQSSACTMNRVYMVVKHLHAQLDDETQQLVAKTDQEKPGYLETDMQNLMGKPLEPIAQKSRDILRDELQGRFLQGMPGMTERRAMLLDPAIKLTDNLTHKCQITKKGMIDDTKLNLEKVFNFLGPPKSVMELVPVAASKPAAVADVTDEALAFLVGATTAVDNNSGAGAAVPTTAAEAAVSLAVAAAASHVWHRLRPHVGPVMQIADAAAAPPTPQT
jgi:hypothetical protein